VYENSMEKSLWQEVMATAGVLILAIVVGMFVMNRQKATVMEPLEVHHHAGFQIYENNVLEDFSRLEYMENAPCKPGTTEPEEHTDETVDMHNGVGDVVHVHHADMTWRNVIEYLQERGGLSAHFGDPRFGVPLTGFVNNEEVADILSYPIKSYDSVVMVYGNLGADYMSKLKKAVTVGHIQEAEAQKENCGL